MNVKNLKVNKMNKTFTKKEIIAKIVKMLKSDNRILCHVANTT